MAQIDQLFSQATEKLKQTVKQGLSFDAAQVKVIGLDDIRAAAGANWSAIGDRVRTNSLNFIQGCLEPDDVVIPAGDGFLVIYADKAARDLDQQANMLRDALNTFYLGEEGMQKLRVSVARQTISASAMETLVQGPPPARAQALDDVAFVPVWSVSKEVVGSYFATPTRNVNGEIAFGYEGDFRESGRNGDADHLALDLKILERAIAGSKQAHKAGLRCITGFNVHSTTLQRRHHWSVYEARLAQVPETWRPGFMAKIAEVEPGTPTITIADWVARLSRLTSGVSLSLHHTDQALVGLEATRAKMVSVGLSEEALRADQYLLACRTIIDRWTPVLHRQRIGLCIDGVARHDVIALACAARVDAVVGPKIWPAVAAPSGVWTVTRADILRRGDEAALSLPRRSSA